MAKAEQEGNKSLAEQGKRVLERMDTIRRPDQQLHLTLQETLRRALETNYAIQIVRYNPAIETTRIVEAEAAFDALFYTNIAKNNIRPEPGKVCPDGLAILQADESTDVRLINKIVVTAKAAGFNNLLFAVKNK